MVSPINSDPVSSITPTQAQLAASSAASSVTPNAPPSATSSAASNVTSTQQQLAAQYSSMALNNTTTSTAAQLIAGSMSASGAVASQSINNETQVAQVSAQADNNTNSYGQSAQTKLRNLSNVNNMI
jgi:hypothetical protein